MTCKVHTNVRSPGLCPICLIEERDRLREAEAEWTAIHEAVSDLYQAYYRVGGDETTRRICVESALGRLMAAWNKMMG